MTDTEAVKRDVHAHLHNLHEHTPYTPVAMILAMTVTSLLSTPLCSKSPSAPGKIPLDDEWLLSYHVTDLVAPDF